MLESNDYESSKPMKSETCRPDYEAMIMRVRAKLGKATGFRDSALDYFEGAQARGPMAELIGELVTICNSLQTEYNRLIKSQEDDKTA